jgi:nicotinate-nucleotide adenylyltransferase
LIVAGLRIGLLGGSFNPVHCGHLRNALESMEALGLDRVDLVCAAQPPHKAAAAEVAPFEDRFALVQAAVDGVAGLAASDIEAKRDGPSYTVETLEAYRRLAPSAELYFLFGLETLYQVHTWREGLRLPDLANLVALQRKKDDPGRLPGYVAKHWPGARSLGESAWEFPSGAGLRLLEAPVLEVSGTDIRQRWLAGRSVRCLVPAAVAAAMEERRAVLERAWRRDASA